MGGTTKQHDTTPASTQRLRDPLIDWLMGGASEFGTQGNGTGSAFDRINARTVAAPERVSVGAGPTTQGINELAGGDSPFFLNMLSRMRPVFDQQRQTALAAAREGSGTLTGSGYANRLGTTINRSLADEEGILSQFGLRGAELEASRQQADAARESTRLQTQAGLDQQRNMGIYGAENEVAMRNAMSFLQLLLGQSMAGVGPQQVTQSGGIGAMLPGVFSLIGNWLGGRNNNSMPTFPGGPGGGAPIPIPFPQGLPQYQP